MWSASNAEKRVRCWTRLTEYHVHTVPQTKCLRISLSDFSGARKFGIHTQARSARFKTGRVLSSLPNRIAATAQKRTLMESSVAMRRSERPKMVSLGSIKCCNNDILLRTGVGLGSSIEKSLTHRGMGRSPPDIDEFKRDKIAKKGRALRSRDSRGPPSSGSRRYSRVNVERKL